MTVPRKVLIFRVGEQSYAIDVAVIQEIVAMPTLAPTPGCPEIVAGLLNLAGRVLPVLDLPRLFNGASEPASLFSALVVLREKYQLALWPSAVECTKLCDAARLHDVESGSSFNDCAVGMLAEGGRAILLLDPERLLLAREREVAAHAARREAERLEQLEEALA